MPKTLLNFQKSDWSNGMVLVTTKLKTKICIV